MVFSLLNYKDDARSHKHKIYLRMLFHAIFEIIKVALMKIKVFWVTLLCGVVKIVTDVSPKFQPLFDVHRAMHRNSIPTVKPTGCTTVSNLFYFGVTLYMFRTVFPSIIRSTILYVQQPNRYCCLLASGYPQYLFDIYLLLYVQSCTPDDGRKDRPKSVECHSKVNKFDTLVHLVDFTIGIILPLSLGCRQSSVLLI